MVGAIADGVDRHAQARIGSPAADFKELFAIHVQLTSVFRLALVWLEHGSRPRAKCPIHEGFDGTDAQPIVTKARSQSESTGLFHQLDRDALRDTQPESPLGMQLLQCHKTLPTVEVVYTRETQLPQHRLGLVKGSHEFCQAGR